MSEFGAPSKWIWLPENSLPEEREAYVCVFRKAFELPLETLEKKTRCLLRISADSRYKLYVNGSFAEAGPAKGDNHVRYYDLIDILPYLGPGKNCIGIEVLRYPALHGFGNHSLFRAETPGLYVEEVNKASKEPVDQTWNDLRPEIGRAHV